MCMFVIVWTVGKLSNNSPFFCVPKKSFSFYEFSLCGFCFIVIVVEEGWIMKDNQMSQRCVMSRHVLPMLFYTIVIKLLLKVKDNEEEEKCINVVRPKKPNLWREMNIRVIGQRRIQINHCMSRASLESG